MTLDSFQPWPALVEGTAAPAIRACVVIPARNEAASLPRCLEALACQQDADGSPLPATSFEVILLLNNCTDGSAAEVRRWHQEHPGLQLHVVERTLGPDEAHVGTARRWLMDTAWSRLRHREPFAVILSTDADSTVATDWLATNLAALDRGADVVGGAVHLLPEDLAALPEPVQHCYRQDRRYAACLAALEDRLDPQPGDPAPRHLDHFGSSLACRTDAYAAAGGMPAVTPLEDEAFIDKVRRAGLCLRHDPAVRVFTSARLDGRAPVGLAALLRLWAELPSHEAHRVPSAAFVEHRFRTLCQLRQIHKTKRIGQFLPSSSEWRDTFARALREEPTYPGFLVAVSCDALIRERFHGAEEEPIRRAIHALGRSLAACSSDAPVATEISASVPGICESIPA